MYKYAVVASVVLFAGVSYASAATSGVTSCLDDDRGYKLINADGTIDPVRLYGLAVKKFSASSLSGQTQTASQIRQLGVTTGDPREWARLFVMTCKQESGCRIARTYSDGSLEKFRGTLANECSYGPLQFCVNEYGLNSWAMVNSPSCTLDAFIRVAQQNRLLTYFGSMQRPQEILQHANWFNRTVQPFADALILVFDPNAPDMRAYQAVAPYFTNPYNSSSLGLGAGAGLGGTGFAGMPSTLGTPTFGATAGVGGVVASQGAVQTTATGGTQPVSTAPQSAGGILVQPHSPVRGAKIYVSWTSVGMAANSCTLKVDGDIRSNASEGMISIIATQGTHSFTFSCRDATGTLREQSDSITVP